MATLLDILVDELGEWPKGWLCAAQDSERLDGQIAFYKSTPTNINGEWSVPGCDGFEYQYLDEDASISNDHATAIITREQWEAAKAAKGLEEAIEAHLEELAAYYCCPVHMLKGQSSGDGMLKFTIPGAINKVNINMTIGEPFNPLQARDRIHEIDRTVEELEEERVSLTQKLSAEGFALILPAVQPVEDMSDWRNWKVVDLIEVHDSVKADCDDCGVYVLIRKEDESYDSDMPVKVRPLDDDEDAAFWPEIAGIRFHSRP
ncbi:MAG: hypothetical protein ACREBG_10795 [Pyrinomonadaceae bacterium]